jgi:hypothetical protein
MPLHGQETVKFYVLWVGRAVPCAPFWWGERPREPLPPIVNRKSMTPRLWQRQPGETPADFTAFAAYLRLKGRRSHRATAELTARSLGAIRRSAPVALAAHAARRGTAIWRSNASGWRRGALPWNGINSVIRTRSRTCCRLSRLLRLAIQFKQLACGLDSNQPLAGKISHDHDIAVFNRACGKTNGSVGAGQDSVEPSSRTADPQSCQ